MHPFCCDGNEKALLHVNGTCTSMYRSIFCEHKTWLLTHLVTLPCLCPSDGWYHQEWMLTHTGYPW